MWLAVRRRCWTADHLERRSIPNQWDCVFCHSARETIDHLLLGCAITAQIWARFLLSVGLHRCTPAGQPTLENFWISARQKVSFSRRRGLDSCIILTSWMIWKERNNRVFNKVSSPLGPLLHRIFDNFRLWRSAGARCLQSLPMLE